jgi:hypothetical protein
MKRRILPVVAALSVAALLALAVRGAEEPKKDEGEKEVVKDYVRMEERAVYQLSNEQRVANVLFQAVYNEPLARAPSALARFRIGRRGFLIGYAFQTQGEIVCLVEREKEDLLRRAANLIKGQNVWIEGTVIPERAGYKCVIVDDIRASATEQRKVSWEVLINWPNERPKKIARPGKYTIRVPNPDVRGKTIEFEVVVREVKAAGGGESD